MKEPLYEDREILNDFVVIILKRAKFLLAIIFLIILVSFLGINVFSKHIYTSTTIISVESIQNLTTWEGQSNNSGSLSAELLFLTNQNTITNALKAMNLASYSAQDGFDYHELMTDKEKFTNIQSSIDANQVNNSNSIIVTFKHTNPIFAQDFLTVLIKSFEESLLEYAKSKLAYEKSVFQSYIQKFEADLNETSQELETLKKNEIAEGTLVIDKFLASISTQPELGGSSQNSLAYLGFVSPDFLKLVNVIIQDSSLAVEYRAKLNKIDSFTLSLDRATEVIDPVQLANEMGASVKLRLLLSIILGGALLAFAIVLLLEYLPDKFSDEQMAQRAIREVTSILSIIPEQSDNYELNAYNQLAGIIQYSGDQDIYAFSGLGYENGVSELVLNIAFSLIRNGRKVLILSFSNDVEHLKNLILNSVDNDNKDLETIIKFKLIDFECPRDSDEEYERLCIELIPHKVISNGQMVLQKVIDEYIKKASSVYDFVLIDGPSFKDTSRFLAMAKIADGIVISIKAKNGSRKELTQLIQILSVCKIPLTGVIFDKHSMKANKL